MERTRDPEDTGGKGFRRIARRADASFESDITISMITDTKFLREMRDEVAGSLRYIGNSSIRTILGWCIEHYDRFGKAPYLNIQDIYNERKDDLPPASADAVGLFLKSLSDKAETIEGFDAAYEIAQARKGLEIARLEEQAREIIKAAQAGDLEEARKLISGLQVHATSDSSIYEAAMECLVTDEQVLREKETREPRPMLWPWLASGQIVEVFAERGVGKTWFAITLAVALTRENFDGEENRFGPWEVRRPCGVLYVDGEMGTHTMKKRILQMAAPRGPQRGASPLQLLTAEDFSHGPGEGKPPLTITNPEWQRTIYRILEENRRLRVLILDNLSSLMPGVDENSKQEFDPVNQWLLSIRNLGVASVFLHHAGKSKEQRGTSGREDNIDWAVRLTAPGGPAKGKAKKDDAEGGRECRFKAAFTKSRHYVEGGAAGFRPFRLRLTQVDAYGNVNWVPDEDDGTASAKQRMMAEIFDGLRGKDIANRFGVDPSRVTYVKNEMIERWGYLSPKGNPTEKGQEWRRRLGVLNAGEE